VAGDFNLSRSLDDRNNDNFSALDASMFNTATNDLCLLELPLRDRLYTWSNRRDSPILIRLDQVFVNAAWNLLFPASALTSRAHDTSDHVPLVASISTSIPRGLIFRYEQSWSLHSVFRSSITYVWHATSRSDATARVVARLKWCRLACKAWTGRTSPFAQHEKDYRVLINLLDGLEEFRLLSPLESRLRTLTIDCLHVSIQERVIHWKAHAKIRYAIKGDENSKFFHATATCRKRRNTIRVIDSDGCSFSDHASKAAALRDFFLNLLGTSSPCQWNFDIFALYSSRPPLPASLSAPFTADEIYRAFADMNKHASLGPDGFGPAFFQTFWPSVADDIYAVFADFHANRIDLSRINRAFWFSFLSSMELNCLGISGLSPYRIAS
jgi:hypothetical protein